MEPTPSGPAPPPASQEDSPSIAFDFTHSDAVEYQLAMWQAHPRARQEWKKARRWVWVSAGMLVVCFPLFLRTLSQGADNPDGIALKLALFGGVSAYSAWWLWEVWRRSRPEALRAAANQAASSEEWNIMYGAHRATIAQDGVTLESRGSLTRTDWSHVRRVIIIGPMMLIEFGTGTAQPIPVRAFGSSEAADAFQRRANQLMAAANQGDAVRILNFLGSNPGICPSCRYDLHGIKEAICPECGLVLTRESAPGLLGISKPLSD